MQRRLRETRGKMTEICPHCRKPRGDSTAHICTANTITVGSAARACPKCADPAGRAHTCDTARADPGPCPNCGAFGCEDWADPRGLYATYARDCERRAKERALAEVVELRRQVDQLRAQLHAGHYVTASSQEHSWAEQVADVRRQHVDQRRAADDLRLRLSAQADEVADLRRQLQGACEWADAFQGGAAAILLLSGETVALREDNADLRRQLVAAAKPRWSCEVDRGGRPEPVLQGHPADDYRTTWTLSLGKLAVAVVRTGWSGNRWTATYASGSAGSYDSLSEAKTAAERACGVEVPDGDWV